MTEEQLAQLGEEEKKMQENPDWQLLQAAILQDISKVNLI